MFRKYFFMALLPVALATSCGRSQSTDLSHTIPANEFQTKIKMDTTAIVIDVRTPAEFSDGHLPGAINIDYRNENFESQIKSLDASKTFYIYCQSGKRSAAAMNKMHSWGFKKIFELKGGFLQWRTAGLPEEK